MNDFPGLDLFIVALCIFGKLMAGKISRKLQYALWLLIPGYLLASRLIHFQSLSAIMAAIRPELAQYPVEFEVKAAHGMNTVRALLIETLTAVEMVKVLDTLRNLRYGVAAVLSIAFVTYNAGFMVRCIKKRRFYKKDARTGMKFICSGFPPDSFFAWAEHLCASGYDAE